MKIYSIDALGNFKGILVNHDGGFTCQNTPFNFAGREKNGHVAFTVVWTNAFQNCNSQTTWHNRIEGKTIITRWELNTFGNPPLNLRGADTFQELP
jgi:hypothetical protein